MKTRINLWSALAYIIGPAVVVGFLASAGPALFGAATATKTAGIIGVCIGAVLGLVIGLIRRFR
jgi:hypothetical protein